MFWNEYSIPGRKESKISKILIVDNETELLKILNLSLMSNGYEAQVTPEPKEALELIQEEILLRTYE